MKQFLQHLISTPVGLAEFLGLMVGLGLILTLPLWFSLLISWIVGFF